ncbi:hypothetical protein UlMin_013578 [Ulmus minor]
MATPKKFRGLFFNINCCVMLSLALLTGAQTLIAPNNKENCSYLVTIETTCTKGAETSNHISLRFGDTNSNDVLVKHLNSKHVRQVDPLEPMVLDDIARKPFQACTVDQFQVKGQCVIYPICYVYLKLSGKDDWRPGFVQVRLLEMGGNNLNSKYFYFRRYLPRHVWHGIDLCDEVITPFGIKHKRKLFVGKKRSLH